MIPEPCPPLDLTADHMDLRRWRDGLHRKARKEREGGAGDFCFWDSRLFYRFAVTIMQRNGSAVLALYAQMADR